MRSALALRDFAFSHEASEQPTRLSGIVDVTAAPANIAADVFALVDGKEYRLGSLTVHKGDTTSTYLMSSNELPTRSTNFEIIVRGSADAARLTTDMTSAMDRRGASSGRESADRTRQMTGCHQAGRPERNRVILAFNPRNPLKNAVASSTGVPLAPFSVRKIDMRLPLVSSLRGNIAHLPHFTIVNSPCQPTPRQRR